MCLSRTSSGVVRADGSGYPMRDDRSRETASQLPRIGCQVESTSRSRHRRHGLFRRSDDRISAPVALVVLRHDRRRIVSFAITAHPTAEWIAPQITEAFPCNDVPRYPNRDRDAACGHIVMRRLRMMGTRDRPTAPRSPWQNGCVERLVGSIRREGIDHVVVFGETHLRRL